MFEATRALAACKDPEPIAVFNNDLQFVASDEEKASIIREWFLHHYTSSESPLEPFTGPPRALSTPISAFEVQHAASKLKNGKDLEDSFLFYAGDQREKQSRSNLTFYMHASLNYIFS